MIIENERQFAPNVCRDLSGNKLETIRSGCFANCSRLVFVYVPDIVRMPGFTDIIKLEFYKNTTDISKGTTSQLFILDSFPGVPS